MYWKVYLKYFTGKTSKTNIVVCLRDIRLRKKIQDKTIQYGEIRLGNKNQLLHKYKFVGFGKAYWIGLKVLQKSIILPNSWLYEEVFAFWGKTILEHSNQPNRMIQQYSLWVKMNRLVYFSTIIFNLSSHPVHSLQCKSLILAEAILFIYFTLFKDQLISISKYSYTPYAKKRRLNSQYFIKYRQF